MTTHDDEPDERDELASAYLDGVASPDERARVDADPELRARVEDLRAARDALVDAPVAPPTAAARDAAIRAAVDAAIVVDLAAHRGRQRLRIASIAAAVLLLLGAAGVLLRSLGDNSETTFKTAAGTLSASSAGSSSSLAATAERNADAGTAFAPSAASGPSMLGSFADRPTLLDAVRAALTSSSSQPTTTATAGSQTTAKTASGGRCVPTAPPDAVNEVFAGSAVLSDAAVQLDVFTLEDGSQRLVVTSSDSCALLFSQGL